MIRACLAAATLAVALLPGALTAQEEIFAITHPVELNAANPATTDVGELVYRGGVEIEPGEANIGGISGLEWYDDRLYAVTDDGRWLTIEPDEIDGKLVDASAITVGHLADERGRRLRGKNAGDAEALTRLPTGKWLVAFEQDHRIWQYTDLGGPTQVSAERPELAAAIELTRTADANGGLETMAASPNTFIACGEWANDGRPNCIHASMGGAASFHLDAPAGIAEVGGVPTDAACKADDTCFVLFRSYVAGQGNRAAIVKLAPDVEPVTLAVLTPSLTLDNFEGLAVREQYGRTYLYIVSDNNFSDDQRTLLMKFEVRQAAPPVLGAPEPVVDFDTMDVVLETALGDITIRLETERAPITAANFLRYVEEARFDGTVFYRAMTLDREPRPNGLLQGGTQFDPKRILPGIPHEPTTITGLSHTHGAVSMAMGEPGSANGDFSIMLQDQTGLDARPDAAEAVWQNGYAVFGYVIDGMAAVQAIHAMPVDPDKGEGWMKGQMLADPVVITRARRAETARD